MLSFLKRIKKFFFRIIGLGPLKRSSFVPAGKWQKIKMETGAHDEDNPWLPYLKRIVQEFNDCPNEFLKKQTTAFTIHPVEDELSLNYLEEMKADPFAASEILTRLSEIPFGTPSLVQSFPFASHMTIQHAYYLNLIKRKFGKFFGVDDFASITEIGGGYGNFCRLSYSMGYEGEYNIIDFPEMQRIQENYLSFSLTKKQKDQFGFYDLSFLSRGKIEKNSLLLASFSYSEMSKEQREKVRPFLARYDWIFIVYASSFASIDNKKYFAELQSDLKSKGFSVSHFKDVHRRCWFFMASSEGCVKNSPSSLRGSVD